MARGDPASTDPKPNEKDAEEERNEDDKQSARFIETARRLGVDETGEKFERAASAVISKRRPK